MTEPAQSPDGGALCLFLAEYAGWLIGSGASCIRLEKNVGRIAAAYGRRVELSINPRHVHVSLLADDNAELRTTIAPARPAPVSFSIIADLSHLSWLIADGRVDFSRAQEMMGRIVAGQAPLRPWAVLLLVSLANASFCRLFGGDVAAMAVVGVATFAGFFLKQRLMAAHTDGRVVMIVCAFVSAVLGASDSLFGLGSTPSVSAATSVLYLVPGIPYLNSFSDMLNRYYICSMSRFMDATVLTACLSAGLGAAMLLMGTDIF